MTRELKTLMDRATERPDTFMPNPAELVAAGRRRVRNRRLTASLATLAAVVLVFAGVTVVLDLQETRDAPPATQPTTSTTPSPGIPDRPEDAYKLCTASNGRVLGSEAWAWTEVLSSTDEYGSASIRREPGEENAAVAIYAFCITQPIASTSVPTGARGGILLRKTPVSSDSSVTTVFGRAYDPSIRVDVLTGDGKTGNAVIKSKFFLYRYLEPRPWPGPVPTVTVRMYDKYGNLNAWGKW
jgi:hypothetical protein